MDNNNQQEKYQQNHFNILDLPEYGYPYKEGQKPFGDEFTFSITDEAKYTKPVDDSLFFTEKSRTHIDTATKINVPFGMPISPENKDQMYTRYSERHPEEYKGFEYVYSQNEEQAVFVNANQYPYIKRRKERRDYLDSLEKKKDVGYQHESRHKHAMKRPRAPTGRFLTKEEAMEQRNGGIKQ
ncbi:hypothetical protein NEOKW01_1226 [Nematocida sp. AWRm80]|nr:hypothetical protein NEOKW01_1226 [Nematocida sp. AWRm80]